MWAINVDPWGVLTKQATNIMKTPGKCFKCVCRRHHFLCSASSRILACFPVQERPLPGSLSVCPLLLMSLNGSFWRCDFPFLHRQTSGISRCRGGAMHQGLNGLIWPHLHLWHCGALWTHREMLTRSLPGLWQTPWGETSVLFHRFCFCFCFLSSTLQTDVSVRLQMLLDEDSENYHVLGSAERGELLFRLFKHLCLGGALNQYEDTVEPYISVTKKMYKELIRYQRCKTIFYFLPKMKTSVSWLNCSHSKTFINWKK